MKTVHDSLIIFKLKIWYIILDMFGTEKYNQLETILG